MISLDTQTDSSFKSLSSESRIPGPPGPPSLTPIRAMIQLQQLRSSCQCGLAELPGPADSEFKFADVLKSDAGFTVAKSTPRPSQLDLNFVVF
jgi:hypothetical protein